MELSLDQRLDSVQKGRRFIERQLDVSRDELERTEEKLQALSKANAILTMDEGENVEYRKLADLTDALTEAQGERIAKEALLRQTEKGEAEYSRLAETFTPVYPRRQRLGAKIAGLRERAGEEVEWLSATLHADYDADKTR